MPLADLTDIDWKSPPFDQYKNIRPLPAVRSGRESVAHARHLLYAGRDKGSTANVLIKLTSKPGLVYQHNLTNEIASLSAINRALPDSRYFPVLEEHGRLRDGRVYLIATLFDEFPLATAIGTEPMPARMVAHLRTAMEVAKALEELHGIPIFHVDLNPMNILHRSDKGRPVIRIVDFESSYDPARYAPGATYDPPTTSGYSAPEVPRQAPDARSDLFSLGAVLYTMLAGFQWTWEAAVSTSIEADRELDPDLKAILLTAVDPNPGRRQRSVRKFGVALAEYLERIWPGRTW